MDAKTAIIKLRSMLLERNGMETELATVNDVLDFIEIEKNAWAKEHENVLKEERMFCLDMAIKSLAKNNGYVAPEYVIEEANQFLNYIRTGAPFPTEEHSEKTEEK